MTTDSWIVDALGADRIRLATTEAARRRLRGTLELQQTPGLERDSTVTDERLRFVAGGMELRVIDLILDGSSERLRSAAADAFQLARVLDLPETPVSKAEALARLGCFGVMGDRAADVRRILRPLDLNLPTASDDWGEQSLGNSSRSLVASLAPERVGRLRCDTEWRSPDSRGTEGFRAKLFGRGRS